MASPPHTIPHSWTCLRSGAFHWRFAPQEISAPARWQNNSSEKTPASKIIPCRNCYVTEFPSSSPPTTPPCFTQRYKPNTKTPAACASTRRKSNRCAKPASTTHLPSTRTCPQLRNSSQATDCKPRNATLSSFAHTARLGIEPTERFSPFSIESFQIRKEITNENEAPVGQRSSSVAVCSWRCSRATTG